MERKLVTVAVDGSAEFTTLTAAAAAQDPAQPLHFVLGAGTYYASDALWISAAGFLR